VLGERHAELDGKVSKTSLLYLHNHEEAKKMAEDKIDKSAAVTPEQQADYYELRAIRIRAKVAEKVLESYGTAISALQTISKMFTRV
jgi:hypothetical protein